ncbi:bis(5'-nucleosyl)-tetraphosphatase (symmetrical) YqeK [Clostridium sporogenes]|uniref:bis(5'-nucleosyl)-tetraphosphatase (symmetrical) YqeK n=1 Tax=Clostridium sporogenes TaxID=1509 RepID=UPI0029016E41|nr:bis(5'-nucleosyl)-tetraphosphatase (symmetrical) YqeK [Clostridium botulinum]
MWTEEQIHTYLKENLKEDRYNHVISVKETAIKLAEKYNVDVYKAKIAALCHDCAKNMSDNELLNMIKEHNINLDWISLKNLQITHGLVATIIMKEKMGIEDIDILNAVEYHTTGRNNMSMLEKIIYLADIIEPLREFNGVEKLRKLALIDIDKAMIESLNSTIQYVVSKGELLHINTVIARNCLVNDKL